MLWLPTLRLLEVDAALPPEGVMGVPETPSIVKVTVPVSVKPVQVTDAVKVTG
jgi:hypothetical protein